MHCLPSRLSTCSPAPIQTSTLTHPKTIHSSTSRWTFSERLRTTHCKNCSHSVVDWVIGLGESHKYNWLQIFSLKKSYSLHSAVCAPPLEYLDAWDTRRPAIYHSQYKRKKTQQLTFYFQPAEVMATSSSRKIYGTVIEGFLQLAYHNASWGVWLYIHHFRQSSRTMPLLRTARGFSPFYLDAA